MPDAIRRTTGFVPSIHAFPFANSWPDGQPVLEIPTPFGTVPVGNAAHGVCGGMVFAALDFYAHGQPIPREPTRPVFRYLARRLMDSWNFPFGGLKYYDWQLRPAATRPGGLRAGLNWLTVAVEWPRIRAVLDSGLPAPLGVVHSHSWHPRELNQNHQVLATGYRQLDDSVVLEIYDPNWPGDDSLTLRFSTADPLADCRIEHGIEGKTVRGLFLTEYRKPLLPPLLG